MPKLNKLGWNLQRKPLGILLFSITLSLFLLNSLYGLDSSLTQNQINTASAINQCFGNISTGDSHVVNESLSSLPNPQYRGAIEQISPALYTSLLDITAGQSVALGTFLEQRFSAVRLGARGFSADGLHGPVFVENRSAESNDKEAKDIFLATPENKWAIWVQGYGLFSRKFARSNVGNRTYRFASGSVLGGADYRWFEGLATGVYAGYLGIYNKFPRGGRIINGTNFGTYINYDAPGNGFYADAVVGGGYSNYSVQRPIKFGSVNRVARSRVNGGDFMTMLATGYDVEISNFTIGPVATMQYTYAGVDRLTEQGAGSLNLKVGHQNGNSLRTHFGGRIAFSWKLTNSILIIPEGRMLWQHEYLQYPRTLSASLDSGSCSTFAYSTESPSRDAAIASAGLVIQLGQHINLNAYYTADFGRRDYVGHLINGGVTLAF